MGTGDTVPGSGNVRPGKSDRLFALADCNSFYASCERVFNPALNNRPVVVLSNNDGCVIARSPEAKQLGIKMGVPAFQIEKLLTGHQVAVFSSNYTLYGDLSSRVMNTLASLVPSLEIYSIDEAFLDFTGLPVNDLNGFALHIRNCVLRNTGIPVGIGIAPTKTLAKIANHRAKKSASPVCILLSDDEIVPALKETPVGEIWGIGKQYAGFLNRHGVISAYDLTRMPDNWVKKNLTVVGLRTKKELAGISCLSLDEIAPSRKAICTSRSFGRSQTELTQLEEAVATFAVSCAEKLRSQGLAASEIMVFIHTNAFRTDLPQYARNRVINIPAPTNDSLELVKLAVGALRSIFHKGYDYKKAGIIVTGLLPDREIQQELFGTVTATRQRTLMESIDEINRKMGHQAVKIATQGIERKWRLRQEKLSPAYTTRWNEIMEIKL